MTHESVLVNINKSRFVVSHKFGGNLHIGHFPACIEGDSVPSETMRTAPVIMSKDRLGLEVVVQVQMHSRGP